MSKYNYKCVVNNTSSKRYYKNVRGKWKRITNAVGMKAELKYRAAGDRGVMTDKTRCYEDIANDKCEQDNVYSSYSDNSMLMMVLLYCIVAIVHTQRLHLNPPSNGLFQLYCCTCAFWIPICFLCIIHTIYARFQVFYSFVPCAFC